MIRPGAWRWRSPRRCRRRQRRAGRSAAASTRASPASSCRSIRRTEWSLETGADRATIRFPGKPLTFSTGEVFDRIPRSRVRNVTVTTRGAMTEIAVELACDCRISTSFVGARYLALDIADRGAAPAAAGPAPGDPGGARGARGDRRRHRRGAADPPDRARGRAGARRAGADRARRGAARSGVGVRGAAAPAPEAAAAPPPPAPVPSDPIAAALDGDQIDAMTVYDRDDAREIARRALAAVPDACLDDAALDVGDWARLAPWPEQRAALRARLVGEFDRPEAEGVRGLARFYVRTGFGAEAGALLAGFPRVDGLDDRALLADLARVVEGGDASPAGPLALPYPCPGRHALWLALGGAAPAFHDAGAFAEVEAAFAELPADLRATLGPRLIGRMLDAARPGEARRLLDTSVRNGDLPTPGLRLAEAPHPRRRGRGRGGARAARRARRGPRPGGAGGADAGGAAGARRRAAAARGRGDRPARRRARAARHRPRARAARAPRRDARRARRAAGRGARGPRGGARPAGRGGAVRGAGRRRPRRGRPAGDAAGALPRDGARRRGPDCGGAGRRPGAALDRRAAGRARAAVAGAAADRPGAGRRRPPVAAGRGRRRSSRSAAARRRAPPSPG